MSDKASRHDLIIVGAGPAAYTAAIYAKRYNIDTVIIGESLGGLAAEAHKVCNFPSRKDISGFDLMQDMYTQVVDMGVPVIMDTVTRIEKRGNRFAVQTMGERTIEGPRVLLTIGTKHRRLELDREQEFLGRGVSYCATCDAMFYRDKTAVVVGGGNSAHTASLYLAEVATKVYQIYRGSALKGEPAWIDQVKARDNITVLFNTNVTELHGDETLESIRIDTSFEGRDTILTDGLFVEIGSTPDRTFSDHLALDTDEQGYIRVDVAQRTNVSGVWAAGDITTASNGFRQIISACSEGAIAAENIFQDLQRAS
jgi:thioredoxin reductase (NADPH)